MFSKKKGETTGWINYTYSRSMNKVNEVVLENKSTSETGTQLIMTVHTHLMPQ